MFRAVGRVLGGLFVNMMIPHTPPPAMAASFRAGCFTLLFAGCLISSAQELLRDGDLESSLPNGQFPSSGFWQPAWLGEAGSIVIPNAGVSSNAFLLYTGAPTNDFWTAPYQDVTTLPGQVFQGSASIRTPPGGSDWVAGTRARVHLAFLDAKTNVLTSFESAALTTLTSVWQQLQVTTEAAPAETAYVRYMCILEKPRGKTNLSVAVVDNCSLQPGIAAWLEVWPRALGIATNLSAGDLTIRNTGNTNIAWRATNNLPWLTVTPSAGTLSPAATQMVHLVVNRLMLTGTDCIQGVLRVVSDAGDLTNRIYVDMPAPPAPQEPAVTRVYGRRLVVRDRLPDGTLAPARNYLVKGAAWSPSSRGTRDVLDERRGEFGKWFVADIQMLRELNANTVYTFLDFGTNTSALRVLDTLYRNGLKALVTVDENGTGNTNKAMEIVRAYKQHPAILGWVLGNEWNINKYHGMFPNTYQGYYDAALLTEQMAQWIKQLDTNHVVVSSHGDIFPLEIGELVNSFCPSVDIWGLNVYRGPSFTTLFDDWAEVTGKPMLFTEFGTDVYRTLMLKLDVGIVPAYGTNIVSADGAVDEAMQANWERGLWRETTNHLSAVTSTGVCLGGTLFEWCDEWWKGQSNHFGQVGRHDNLGFYASWNPASLPDGVANEEWWGLVSLDRLPRMNYSFFQEDFASAQASDDTDGDGLPDSWEYDVVDASPGHSLTDIDQVRPNDDLDGDGATNFQEYIAGTDPWNEHGVMRVAIARSPSPGVITLTWPAVAGRTYAVEFNGHPGPSGWQPLPGAITIAGGTARVSDTPGALVTSRFYRVRVTAAR